MAPPPGNLDASPINNFEAQSCLPAPWVSMGPHALLGRVSGVHRVSTWVTSVPALPVHPSDPVLIVGPRRCQASPRVTPGRSLLHPGGLAGQWPRPSVPGPGTRDLAQRVARVQASEQLPLASELCLAQHQAPGASLEAVVGPNHRTEPLALAPGSPRGAPCSPTFSRGTR